MLLTAYYVLPITSEPIKGGAVLVRNGRIADVGPASILTERYPDEAVTDCGRTAIIPGLVDTHTHLEYTVMRGFVHDVPYADWLIAINDRNAVMTIDDWRASAMLGGIECIKSGITTIADVTDTGASYEAAQQLGLRGIFYREVGAIDKGRVDHAMRKADTDINRWMGEVDSDRITIGIAPYSIYTCHPSVFSRVSEYAGNDMPVAIHIATSRDEYEFVKYGSPKLMEYAMGKRGGYVETPPWMPTGVTPVKYALNWGAFDAGQVLAVHATYVAPEDIDILQNSGVSIAACPLSNAQLGMGVAPIMEYLRRGIAVGIGTDSPAATESTNMLTAMRTGMLFARAIEPKNFLTAGKTLELGTIDGARALGLEDKVGSIEIGKAADLVAVDVSGSYQAATPDSISSAVIYAAGHDICMTMVGGKILYDKEGLHLDVDVAEALRRPIAIRSKLRGDK